VHGDNPAVASRPRLDRREMPLAALVEL